MFYGPSSHAYCMFHTQPTALTVLIGLYQVGVYKDSTLQFPLKSISSETQNPVLLFPRLFLQFFQRLARHIVCPVSNIGKSAAKPRHASSIHCWQSLKFDVNSTPDPIFGVSIVFVILCDQLHDLAFQNRDFSILEVSKEMPAFFCHIRIRRIHDIHYHSLARSLPPNSRNGW